MARRPRKRQARKRAKPVLLLGKRLRANKDTPLGGGLTATLLTEYIAGEERYSVELNLRTRGAGDLQLSMALEGRDSGQAAADHAEQVLTHFASALRVAGAT